MDKDREPKFDMEAVARLLALTGNRPRVSEDSMPKRTPDGQRYLTKTYLIDSSDKNLLNKTDFTPTLISSRHNAPNLTREEKYPYIFKGKDYATAEALYAAMKAWEDNMNDKGGLTYKSSVTGREYPATEAGDAGMAREEEVLRAWRLTLGDKPKIISKLDELTKFANRKRI